MQETRLCRTETRSREGCREFCEWSGCFCELDNQQWKVWMPVRLLQSLSVTERGFSFQGLLSLAIGFTWFIYSVLHSYKCYITIFETAGNKQRIGHSLFPSLAASPSLLGRSRGRAAKRRAVGREGLANFALDHVFLECQLHVTCEPVECQIESRMSSVPWEASR